MAGAPIRDPVADHLLTPQNAALAVIDYQPSQFAAVRSIDPDVLLENIVSTVKTAKADWAREETVADVVEIVRTERLLRA